MSVVTPLDPGDRSRLPGGRLIATVVLAALVGSTGPLARQQSQTPALDEPIQMRMERHARELEERRERQLRVGLVDEAAQTARELEEMKRAQIEKCSHSWSLQDMALGSRLTKEQSNELLRFSKQPLTQIAECMWRPGVARAPFSAPGLFPNGTIDPQKAQRDSAASRVANEITGRSTRAMLFVEPALTATADSDLFDPLMGANVIVTTSPEFTQMLLDLVRLSLPGGDQTEANAVFERMLAVARRSAQSNPAGVLYVLETKRQFDEARGDVTAALGRARAEVDFVETQFGSSSIQVCPPLWQTASLLQSSGQADAALEAVQRCLALAAPRGASSVTHASALNNLGVVLHRRGELERALDAYQKSLAAFQRSNLAIQGATIASQAPLQQVHANLGLAYWQLGAVPQAYQHLQLARQQMRTEGDYLLTERGILEAMTKLSAELDVFLTVERAAGRSQPANGTTGLALPMLLERKGFALSSKAATLKALAGEPAQLREYRTLLAYRSRLARAAPATAKERADHRSTVGEVDAQIQALEADAKQRATIAVLLAAEAAPHPQSKAYQDALSKASQKLLAQHYKKLDRKSDDNRSMIQAMTDIQRQAEAEVAPRFKEYLEAQQRTARATREDLVQNIQAAIPDASALVEMVRYRPFSTAGAVADRWAPARYGAYVVRRSGTPIFVDCGEAAPIDEMIVEFRRTLSQPRGTLAHDLGRRLDAALMQPLRAALGPATQVYLAPDGALNLVPFGALVDEHDRYLVETFTFNYLSSGRDLIREPPAATAAPKPAVVIADPAFDAGATAAAASGTPPAQLRSVLGNHFEPLPGTAAEARAIKAVLVDAAVFQGDQATETALKSVSSPRVLHVATHGFFLQDQDLAVATAPGTATAVEDPMLRFGLVFAGANAGRSGSDDGVLTALEAAALALTGTELVVLSACETGVGDVRTGEGVFGLRRAFMVAGAETLVMSLWQVDDDATRQLMVEFYGRLAKGEGRAEALRQASLALLRDPARRHPFFWASFISTGEAWPHAPLTDDLQPVLRCGAANEHARDGGEQPLPQRLQRVLILPVIKLRRLVEEAADALGDRGVIHLAEVPGEHRLHRQSQRRRHGDDERAGTRQHRVQAQEPFGVLVVVVLDRPRRPLLRSQASRRVHGRRHVGSVQPTALDVVLLIRDAEQHVQERGDKACAACFVGRAQRLAHQEIAVKPEARFAGLLGAQERAARDVLAPQPDCGGWIAGRRRRSGRRHRVGNPHADGTRSGRRAADFDVCVRGLPAIDGRAFKQPSSGRDLAVDAAGAHAPTRRDVLDWRSRYRRRPMR